MTDYNSIHTGEEIDDAITKVAGIEAGADVTDTATVTAAGALMDSELADIAAIKALNQGVATTDSPLFTNTEFAAIAATIAATAVDVFVYDTSKDSDGGAWRKRTQHTSWYNETLNTATRGSRREFPAVAVIVAESNKVTIYDGDDPALPMWMVFNAGLMSYIYQANISSAVMLNGRLAVGQNLTAGISLTDFLADKNICSLGHASANFVIVTPISTRNGGTRILTADILIASGAVNDVAMTVLPDAPIDPATGLPVPTIAVATAGGVSVIKDDGTVADITNSSSIYTTSFNVGFDSQNNLWLDQGSNSLSYNGWVYVFAMPLSGDTAVTINTQTGSGDDPIAMFQRNVSSGGSIPFQVTGGDTLLANSNIATNGGLGILSVDYADSTKSMGARITSSFNTGYQNGDIKGAFLADTDDTDLVGSDVVTNGGFATDTDWTKGTGWTIASNVASSDGSQTADSDLEQAVTTVVGKQYILQFTVSNYSAGNVAGVIDSTEIVADKAANGSYSGKFTATSASHTVKIRADLDFVGDIDDVSFSLADVDRSVNNNGLTVNGTVTRSPVATGAELVAYSGFSASNYLEQPYNSDLDFGTGDFSIIGWIKEAANTAVETILERDSATTAQRFTLAVNASGFLTFTCDDDTTARTATSTIAIDNGTWTHFVATYDGAGGLNIYLNGVLNDTETGAALLTLNNASAVLRVGLAADGGEALTNGSLALLRISATAPTAEQIKKIYEDEKVLFQEGAACTIYGASDAVTALAHDPVTDLLHVGTSAGRSVFQGLRRVSNTTTAVGTAISASNGLVVEE